LIDTGVHSLASGVYDTDPPIQIVDGMCHVPVLRELEGLLLRPAHSVRVWILFQTLHEEGRFHIPATVVMYEAQGHEFRQELPFRFTGAVSALAAPRPPSAAERRCLARATNA